MRINKKITDDLVDYIQKQYEFNVEDYPDMLEHLLDLQLCIDEAVLSRYFGNTKESADAKKYWRQHLKFETRKTGRQLLDKINA